MLMAADILLYQTDLVPIGKDQKQHVEIARTIAERFNNKYSPTFVVPDCYFPKTGAKIQNLLDPTAKMGKTDDNTNGVVFLLDDKDTIARKFKRAVTDSGNEIIVSPEKPGISNLITIYSVFTDKTQSEVEQEFSGRSYAEFKTAVGDAVIAKIAPIQDKYHDLMKNKDYLNAIMKEGAENRPILPKNTQKSQEENRACGDAKIGLHGRIYKNFDKIGKNTTK